MLTTTLRNVGGSVMFAIPKAILESLHLQANTSVGLSVSDGRLIIDPTPRPRYSLSQLMAQCDLAAEIDTQSAEWLDDAPTGREEI